MTDFCSERSLTAVEPLHATAIHHPVWVMLEYRRPWKAKATSDNELPTAVATHLHEQLQAVNGRLQFIRQMGRTGPELALFIGRIDDQSPVTYRFSLTRYDELLDLDLAALVLRGPALFQQTEPVPQIFVCTNGKRDRCCALFGAALYRQLADTLGDRVWQTTHLGGHRFAPTLLTLPDGLCHGRVTAETAPTWLAAYEQGQITLDHLRGRVCYDAPTQAAETFLRRETGIRAAFAYRHESTTPTADGWTVVFTAAAGQPRHILTITPAEPLALVASCDGTAVKQIPQFALAAHQVA